MKKIIYELAEDAYILELVHTMRNTSLRRYAELNKIKRCAKSSLTHGNISVDFYNRMFTGGDLLHHYSDVNSKRIFDYYHKR